MIPYYLCKVLQILIVFIVYSSAFFDNIDIVDDFDYESDVFFEILKPSELSYTYRIRPASNFGKPLNGSIRPFKSKLVPTEPANGCKIPQNVFDLEGNIALVERGICTFKQKAVNAEEAGAIGIIISDYDLTSDMYIDMLDDESVRQTSISAAFLLGQDGYMIKSTLRRLNQKYADINIPLNLTRIAVPNRRRPPWLVW